MFGFRRSPKSPARVCPPAFRRGLRLEWLEDRSTPSVFFVDDNLVDQTPLSQLTNLGYTVIDQNGDSKLDAGDLVRVTLPGQSTTTDFTFGTAATQTAANGSAGVAFGNIATALTAAANASGTDTIYLGQGTYNESLNVNSPVNLIGTSNTATNVVIDPNSGAGVTISASGVTLQNLLVTGAGDGIVTSGTGVTDLTLNNVSVGGDNPATSGTTESNTGVGLNLTGAGTGTLTLTNVTLSGNATQAYNIGGFATVNLSGLGSTAGTNASSLSFSTGLSNATLNLTSNATTAQTITINGTSVQLGGETIPLTNVDALSVTGGTGVDTFVVTPPTSGGPAITINGGGPVPSSGTGTTGDILDLTSTAGLTFNNVAPSNNGFSGSISASGAPAINFSGIENFADGATISGRVTDQTNAGVGNVTVRLDFGANGTVDLTTTTDANGNYTFQGLPPGNYRVRIVTPAGATQTSQNPADLTNVALGQTSPNVNFQIGTGSTNTGGTVTGVVFADTVDQNGTRDSGENGVRGVTVYLDLNGNGRLDRNEPTAVTDNTGAFTLTTTQNGTFQVRAVLSPGYLRSSGFPSVTLNAGNTATADIGLFTNLPPQATPARRLAAGYIVGGHAHVKVFNAEGEVEDDREVFQGQNMADVRVAVADVTGDGVEDVIVGTGPGVPTQVVVLDGTDLHEIARLTPFESGFTGGVYVAAGDVNHDGISDIIVTPDQGGGPRVLVFAGGTPGAAGTFQQIASFFGIDDANFRGGARASLADINHDGVPDLVVAAGFGGGPRVAFFDGNSILSGLTRLVNDIFVFEQTLRNGVYVTAGDVDGDGFADLIVGGGPGGAPRVMALSGRDLLQGKAANSQMLANFFAGSSDDRGGVRVTAKDTDGDGRAEIFTGSGDHNHGRVHRFRGNGDDGGFDFDAGDDNGAQVG